MIVIDNLRSDQWKIIEPLVLEDFVIDYDEMYTSILPTATQYARNAIFAGTVSISTATTYPLTVKSTDADAADIFKVTADDDGLVASVHKDASDNGELYVWSGAQAANIQLYGGTGNATFAGDLTASQLTIDDYIYHNGDTNTYIYFETDSIKLRTGGTDRLTLNSAPFFNDKLGVGMTPVEVLDIKKEVSLKPPFSCLRKYQFVISNICVNC